ncbi:hypothetical protein IMY05_014G0032500 [Salix suchowensis]|nr:hypothetical protein IMY05_014G0032500 [Salix suchowensis]
MCVANTLVCLLFARGTDGGLMVQFVTHLFYIALWFQLLPALTILLNDDEVQLLYILVEDVTLIIGSQGNRKPTSDVL